MDEETHYEIHGENTGLVGFIKCTEGHVKGICEEVNRESIKEENVRYNENGSPIKGENVNYNAITEEEYKELKRIVKENKK